MTTHDAAFSPQPVLTVRATPLSAQHFHRQRPESMDVRPWRGAIRPAVAFAIALVCAFAFALPNRATAAPRDRMAPTSPTQLRVSATGAYEVSLSWEASSDASGVASYRIHISDGRELSVPATRTRARLTWGLSPNVTYCFYVTALDGAGNRSRPSAPVEVTLPDDVTAPTSPVPALTHGGSRTLSFSWQPAVDDGPKVSYEVSLDGTAVMSGSATKATLTDLDPDTTYAVSVRALDADGNASTWSEPLVVATDASSGNDVGAPSAPGRLAVFEDYCGDVFLVWDESTDDRDPSSSLVYEIYVNGTLREVVMGRVWAAFNLTDEGLTQFEVVAVDSAGNAAPPVTQALVLQGECS